MFPFEDIIILSKKEQVAFSAKHKN